MYSYKQALELLNQYKAQGLSKSEICIKMAELCMGWPYVWGGYGQYCTPTNRNSYANRSTCPSDESGVIKKKCQVLNGSKSGCAGCKYYPGGDKTLFFDCRGFTRWILGKVSLTLQGAGATSQWNTEANWTEKGPIASMPKDKVCCVFMQKGNTMSHTGLHVGGGKIIHCSGEVKTGKSTDRGWTHYAIPKGLDGSVEPVTPTRSTIRKGSKGEDVKYAQQKLISLGYDLSPYGADGSFGTKTQTAVKAFQRDHGLSADGIIGSNTWAALEQASPDQKTEELYTVTIPHQTKAAADTLAALYKDSTVSKEG